MAPNPILPSIKSLLFAEAKEPQLGIVTKSSVAAEIFVRGFTKHGTFDFRQTPSADRVESVTYHRIPELPLAVYAGTANPSVRVGHTFIIVLLRMAGFPVYRLIQGYVAYGVEVVWPPSSIKPPTEGPSLLRSITGTDPAAGAEISETVPTNARWCLKLFRFALITSAAVVDRSVRLIIDDGAIPLFESEPMPVQTAGLLRTYNFISGWPIRETAFEVSNVIRHILPPNLLLFQGWRAYTSTSNLQAGDNFGAPQLYVEEWIEE